MKCPSCNDTGTVVDTQGFSWPCYNTRCSAANGMALQSKFEDIAMSITLFNLEKSGARYGEYAYTETQEAWKLFNLAYAMGVESMRADAIEVIDTAFHDHVFTAADAGLVGSVTARLRAKVGNIGKSNSHIAPEPKLTCPKCKTDRLKSTCPNNGDNCPMQGEAQSTTEDIV